MSRQYTRFVARIVAGCLILLQDPALQAQGQGKKGNTKGTVRPTQGTADEVTAPRPRGRALPRTSPPPIEPSEPAAETDDAPPARPKAEALRVEKLPPELEKILKDWETQSAKVQKLTGAFERHRYDYVFEVEYQSFGRFAYETPDKGAYEFEGEKIPKDAVSRKLNEAKKPYALKADESQKWVCNGKEVLKIDDQRKTYEKVLIPVENQGENIIDGPLPFLFGMKAEAAKRRYKFELIEGKGKHKDAIWLTVTPKLAKDSVNWREATVIIDPKTFLPIAVKLVDPSNNAETVHYFTTSEYQVNANAKPWEIWKRDPFKPDLKKYQLVLNSNPAIPTDGPQQSPTTSKPAAGGAASGATKGRTSANDRTDRELPRSADASGGAPKKKPAAPRN